MEKLVVIPTFNEKENISNILHAIFSMEAGFHVLVIDDGSPDGTAQIRKRPSAKIFWPAVHRRTEREAWIRNCLHTWV
ncbi:MAG: glycosyltransferase [Chitinophagaceae bacterium]